MAAIDAILPTTDLLGLAPPQHTASFVVALTDTELSAAWLEPLLPCLGDKRKEGEEVIPRSDYRPSAVQITSLLTGEAFLFPNALGLVAKVWHSLT